MSFCISTYFFLDDPNFSSNASSTPWCGSTSSQRPRAPNRCPEQAKCHATTPAEPPCNYCSGAPSYCSTSWRIGPARKAAWNVWTNGFHCSVSTFLWSKSTPWRQPRWTSTHFKREGDEQSLTFDSGVAVGSSIGHAIGGFFGGGSSSAPVEAQQAGNEVTQQAQDGAYQNNSWGARSCETDAKSFTKCLDENGGNMQVCGWYLDQLKACQAAASQY